VSQTKSIDPGVGTAAVGGGTLYDRALGLVGGAMLLAALVLFVFGGRGDGGGTSVGAGPAQLALSAPGNGAVVSTPLRLTFRTAGAALTSTPTGWGVDGHHVHAEINGQEVMPGQKDISRAADDSYVWVLPESPRGDVSVRLVWSDSRHRAVVDGATERIWIRVE
jgi:hypothetical protein